MSNNRYVILNCPTLMGNRLCYSKVIKQCADCSDCLLKQIVEKCKAEINLRPDANIDDDFAREILELLDIREVE